MRIRILSLMICCLSVCLLSGCDPAENEPSAQKPAVDVMTAKYTSVPVKLDGVLDEPIWQEAQVYEMYLPADRAAKGELQKAGAVRLAWDDKYFYIGIKFDDSDISAKGKVDQLHHYKFGDVCELFLKPNDEKWYWELYVTPAVYKTTFFLLSERQFGSSKECRSGLQVAAKCEGTLNNQQDTDKSWTAEMAMPIKDLTARGEKFGPDANWRILVARYNYSYQLGEDSPELSASPRLSATNYHLTDEYAVLKLVK